VFRDCAPCPALSASSKGSHFAYYALHIGAQFDMPDIKDLNRGKPTLLHSNHIMRSTRYRLQETCPELAEVSPYETYQLSRFLGESADYKSLVVPTETSNDLARYTDHVIALEKQIQAIDLIINDI
jgi:hypothetical protein